MSCDGVVAVCIEKRTGRGPKPVITEWQLWGRWGIWVRAGSGHCLGWHLIRQYAALLNRPKQRVHQRHVTGDGHCCDHERQISRRSWYITPTFKQEGSGRGDVTPLYRLLLWKNKGEYYYCYYYLDSYKTKERLWFRFDTVSNNTNLMPSFSLLSLGRSLTLCPYFKITLT